MAMHKPAGLWEDHEPEFQLRSDEEIALDITKGMTLMKGQLKRRGKRKAK